MLGVPSVEGENIMDIILVDSSIEDAAFEERVLQSVMVNPVHTCRNARAALAYMLQDEGRRVRLPQLVFADVTRPESGGMELLDALRDDPRFAHVPVVIMRPGPNGDHPAAPARCAFVDKPLDLGGIAEALRTAGVTWVLTDSLPAGAVHRVWPESMWAPAPVSG
jgi:CheY-like chemotaxis protein